MSPLHGAKKWLNLREYNEPMWVAHYYYDPTKPAIHLIRSHYTCLYSDNNNEY